MPIRVTCPGCHKRFNVSDKFAGKEGPCPKCKTKIKIPDKDDEVVIHEPESYGPKDQVGRGVLKPITRDETRLSAVQLTLIAAAIIGFFVAAFLMRMMLDDKREFSVILLGAAALVIAIPVVYAGYSFLRDPELGIFPPRERWARIAVCAALYAATWAAMPLAEYAFDGYELGAWISATIAMVCVGGAIGMYSFDFDYLTGILHYGLYLGICLLGRWIAGFGVMPGMLEDSAMTESGAQAGWDLAIRLWACWIG